jgi:hypothetical protein
MGCEGCLKFIFSALQAGFHKTCILKENLMELMNQPFTGQLGDRLIDLLNSPDFHTLNIVVAFAKNSGA